MEHVSLREANQNLSRYVEAVQQGQEVVITRRGVPVARLVAVASVKQLNAEQQEARKRTWKRMRKGYSLGGAKPDRNELHER